MKPSKLLLMAGLLLAALGWVGLMGLVASSAKPVREQVDVGPYTDDGSIKAEITHLERDGFHLTLSVKVTDKDGKTYGGLDDNDLVVSEQGKPVNVSKLIPAGQAPLRVCLAIDYSGSMAGKKIVGAKKAALALLGMLRDDRDHLAIFAFMGKPGGQELLPIGPLTPERRQQAADAIQNTKLAGQTPMMTTMQVALKAMENVKGRRIMIVMTDGKDTAPPKQQKTLKPQLIDAAKNQGMPLYMIALEGGGSNDEFGMKAFADATHGKYLFAPSPDNLEGIYQQIGASLQDEYTIEYDSPNPVEDGSTREVVVTVRSGAKGTETSTSYHVPGLVSAVAASKTADDGTASADAPPFLSVIIPLGLLLGLLFAAPHFLRKRGIAAAT